MSFEPPAHWQTLSGPTNWFRLSFPPGWTATQVDATVTLASPEGEAVLTVRSAWNRSAEETSLDRLVSPEGLFFGTRHVRDAATIPGESESFGLAGEGLMEPRPAWWKRPFTPPKWRRWRLWGLRQGPIVLIGQLVHSAAPDQEIESVAALILRTIEFTSHPADPPEVFADRVLALAKDKFPLLDCQAGEGFQLKLGESNVNLFNFYRSYTKVPERFEEIMLPALTTVVQIQGWGSAQSDPPLAQVRERIMPMLYPEEVWREQFPNFVGQPWIATMAVLYVIDESQAYWYIRRELLSQWGISPEELHETAVANLESYFDDKPIEMAVAGGDVGPTMLMPTQPDSYNAVRVLSERFREKLRDVMGSPFAIGLPSRDFFVAVSLDSAEMVEHVRQRVRDDHEEMDHPLTKELLLVTPDGVSAFAD